METLEDLILEPEDLEREELERGLPCDGPLVQIMLENRSSRIRLLGRVVLLILGMPLIFVWMIFELIRDIVHNCG